MPLSHSLTALLLIFGNVCLVSVAQILIKIGANSLSSHEADKTAFSLIINVITTPKIVLGTVCYIISLTLWIYILMRTKLSVAYPLMSLSYVTVMILSAYFLKENVHIVQWLGAILIIAGITSMFSFG